MATLNEIAYNIKGLMSGGQESVENSIDTRQIKHWIHYHRAKIIEEKIKVAFELINKMSEHKHD